MDRGSLPSEDCHEKVAENRLFTIYCKHGNKTYMFYYHPPCIFWMHICIITRLLLI